MSSRSRAGLALILLLLAAGGAAMLLRPAPVNPEAPPPPLAKAGGKIRDAETAVAHSEKRPPAARLGSASKEEKARLHGASVAIELEPDMAAFGDPGPEGLAAAWEAVRDEHDPAAKLAVMRQAAAKGAPELAAILKEGLAAEHPQIRYEAVELVEPLQGRDEKTRREVLGAAASAADVTVAAAALGQLTQDPRKADLEAMFSFLDHPDPETRAAARGTIDFLIDAEFASKEEASAWWKGNAARFDDELAPVE